MRWNTWNTKDLKYIPGKGAEDSFVLWHIFDTCQLFEQSYWHSYSIIQFSLPLDLDRWPSPSSATSASATRCCRYTRGKHGSTSCPSSSSLSPSTRPSFLRFSSNSKKSTGRDTQPWGQQSSDLMKLTSGAWQEKRLQKRVAIDNSYWTFQSIHHVDQTAVHGRDSGRVAPLLQQPHLHRPSEFQGIELRRHVRYSDSRQMYSQSTKVMVCIYKICKIS